MNNLSKFSVLRIGAADRSYGFSLVVISLCAIFVLCFANISYSGGEPLSPSEIETLTVMEQSSSSALISGGDYSAILFILSTILQVAFLLFAPVTLGFAIAKRKQISLFVSNRLVKPLKSSDHREYTRIPTMLGTARVKIQHRISGDVLGEGNLLDISRGGMAVMLAEGATMPEDMSQVVLSIEVLGKKNIQLSGIAGAIAWLAGEKAGLQFENALSFGTDTLSEIFNSREYAVETVREKK